MGSKLRPTEVTACTNIALIKYWGKSSLRHNFPAVGSLSLTLKEFTTKTKLLASNNSKDVFLLDNEPMEPPEVERVLKLLRAVPRRPPVHFSSSNSFPTAAGLASSASGGAAAVMAVWAGFSQRWEFPRIVQLALEFSGSAPRSLLGGFVILEPHRGRRRVEVRTVPSPLLEQLRVVVVECGKERKRILSREAMELSRKTSPYYSAWVKSHKSDLRAGLHALEKGDLEQLLEIMEHNTLKMHALAHTSRPPVIFWNSTSLALLHLIAEKRRQGWLGGFTLDAGPHVKIFTDRETAPRWVQLVRELPGVTQVMIASPGDPPQVIVEGEVWSWQEMLFCT